jgi:hypothetical protein
MSLKQLAPLDHRRYLQSEFTNEDSMLDQSVSKIFHSHRPTSTERPLTGNSIMNPKKNIINTIISQHLTGRGLQASYRTFQDEIDENCDGKPKTSEVRFFEERYRALKNQIMIAFQEGDSQQFWSLRDGLLDDLNYYKRDFGDDPELDILVRVYFALYFLLPNSFRTSSLTFEDS